MIEFLSTKAGVVACRLSREITPEDTDRLSHELELSFENDRITHFYYEIDEFLEFTAESVMHGLRHALAMLAHRHQLGRIAVVSADPVLRSLWKIESALLPGLTYRTFHHNRRHEALAWIEGLAAGQAREALTIVPSSRTDVFGIEIADAIGPDDIAAAAERLEQASKSQRIAGLLLSFRPSWRFEQSPGPETPPLADRLRGLASLRLLALVDAPDALNRLANVARPLLKLDVRSFDRAEEDAAWEWLQASPLRRSAKSHGEEMHGGDHGSA